MPRAIPQNSTTGSHRALLSPFHPFTDPEKYGALKAFIIHTLVDTKRRAWAVTLVLGVCFVVFVVHSLREAEREVVRRRIREGRGLRMESQASKTKRIKEKNKGGDAAVLRGGGVGEDHRKGSRGAAGTIIIRRKGKGRGWEGMSKVEDDAYSYTSGEDGIDDEWGEEWDAFYQSQEQSQDEEGKEEGPSEQHKNADRKGKCDTRGASSHDGGIRGGGDVHDASRCSECLAWAEYGRFDTSDFQEEHEDYYEWAAKKGRPWIWEGQERGIINENDESILTSGCVGSGGRVRLAYTGSDDMMGRYTLTEG